MKKIALSLVLLSSTCILFASSKSNKKEKKVTKKIEECPSNIIKFPHQVSCPNGTTSVDYTVSVRIETCPGEYPRVTNRTINRPDPRTVCN